MNLQSPDKVWDIHVHMVGFESRRTGNYTCLEAIPRFLVKAMMRWFNLSPAAVEVPGVDDIIADHIFCHLNQSPIDRAVMLAFDATYRTNGILNRAETYLKVSNDYVAGLAEAHEKALFGASIHPYRLDAREALEKAVAQGACLVKWLPSTQLIDLAHPKCVQFYDMLAHYKLPLLCHTGKEHTLPGGTDEMNAPRHLQHALKRGVTVIASHCGSRALPTDPDYFDQWVQLTRRFPNVYGDLSAFGLLMRRFTLKKILNDRVLKRRILYGSDFPIQPVVWSYLPDIAIRDLMKLSKVSNPLEKSYKLLHKAGVPDTSFVMAEKILRLNS